MSNKSATFTYLKICAAEQLLEAVSEPAPNTKLYFTFGKTDAWPDENNPNTPNTSIATTYEVWNNMIGGKRLLGGDFKHVIPRYNWSSGETYIAYDDKNSNLLDGNTKFYTLTDQFSVYKCIANANGSISTIKPTSLSPFENQKTSDGYIWKYMYTISDVERLRFTTSNYIPVKTLGADDGSLQWQVQSSAQKGAIDSILILNGGTGYTNASNLTITISGDGSGALGFVGINNISNSINSITITDNGLDYTFANVRVLDASVPPGSGALFRPIISPPGGHGSNPIYELGGKDVMINAKLRYDEEGVIPVTNDYRQISILKDPYNRGSSNIATAAAYVQAFEVTASGFGNYLQDEIVYQGSSLSTATFVGKVVSWNSATSKVLLINTTGSVTLSQSLFGSQSFTTRIATSTQQGTLEKNSGQILWVENIKPIIRSSDQIEDFKIVVKF